MNKRWIKKLEITLLDIRFDSGLYLNILGIDLDSGGENERCHSLFCVHVTVMFTYLEIFGFILTNTFPEESE